MYYKLKNIKIVRILIFFILIFFSVDLIFFVSIFSLYIYFIILNILFFVRYQDNINFILPYYFNYFSFFPFSHWIFHYLPYIFISSLSLILSLSFSRNSFNLSFSQILFFSFFLPLFIFLISNLHIHMAAYKCNNIFTL